MYVCVVTVVTVVELMNTRFKKGLHAHFTYKHGDDNGGYCIHNALLLTLKLGGYLFLSLLALSSSSLGNMMS